MLWQLKTLKQTVHAEWTCACNYNLSMNTQSCAIRWGIICLKDHLGTLWPNKNITIHKYRCIYVCLKRSNKQLLDPQRNHSLPSPGNKRTDLCWRKDFCPCCMKPYQDCFPITVLSNSTSSGMDWSETLLVAPWNTSTVYFAASFAETQKCRELCHLV